MKKRLLPLVMVPSLLIFSSCTPGDAAGRAQAGVDEIRASVEKYRDVEVAIAAGYVRDPLDTCERPSHLAQPAELGAMGIHYLRLDALGIDENGVRLDVKGTHTDFTDPAVLIYEPQEDGSLELVGVENIVSAESWRAAGNSRAPTFNGMPFHHFAEDPSRSTAEYYDLHIWLRDSPDGTFSQYNRAVSCEHHVIVMPMIHYMGIDATHTGH